MTPVIYPLLPGGNPFGGRNQLMGNKLVNDKLHGVTKGRTGYLGTKVIPVSCPTTLPIHQSLLYFCGCVRGGECVRA